MRATPKASPHQARYLANAWGSDRLIRIMVRGRDGASPFIDPTDAALLKRSWIAPRGMRFFENGYEWQPHAVTRSGLAALATFLANLSGAS